MQGRSAVSAAWSHKVQMGWIDVGVVGEGNVFVRVQAELTEIKEGLKSRVAFNQTD